MAAEYDDLAWFYDRYWGPRFHDAAERPLAGLLYAATTPGARVLDLCCGTGHLTARMLQRGYRPIGIDCSLEMLRTAARRVPGVPLVCADAATFHVAGVCAAAVCTFDSLNHVMTDAALRRSFACVREALLPGARFVFDINTEDAYLSEWGKSSATVDPDAALFVRGTYDRRNGVGETVVTMFRLDGGWRRSDVRVRQRALEPSSLNRLLRDAGFCDVRIVPAADAGMLGDIAVGRMFVVARRDG